MAHFLCKDPSWSTTITSRAIQGQLHILSQLRPMLSRAHLLTYSPAPPAIPACLSPLGSLSRTTPSLIPAIMTLSQPFLPHRSSSPCHSNHFLPGWGIQEIMSSFPNTIPPKEPQVGLQSHSRVNLHLRHLLFPKALSTEVPGPQKGSYGEVPPGILSCGMGSLQKTFPSPSSLPTHFPGR